MHKLPERFRTWLLVFICALVLSLCAGPSHNPDANFYYGVALRITRGEFLASIDGLTAPLLSWLLVPLLKVGLSPHLSYRIVNSAALSVIVVCAIDIMKICALARKFQLLIGTLLVVQILQFTIFQVSADVLAAACYALTLVYWLRHLELSYPRQCMCLGMLGALGFYAKPAQFFVFLSCIFLFFGFRVVFLRMRLATAAYMLSLIAITFAILCLPWILTISDKYEKLVISGQQFVTYGDIHLRDYTPDLTLTDYIGSVTTQGGVQSRSIYLRLGDIPRRIGQSWQLLRPLLLEYYFGFSALLLFLFFNIYALIVAWRKKDLNIILIAVFLVSQIFVYFIIWGARFRFYYPGLICLDVLFAFGLYQCLDRVKHSKILIKADRFGIMHKVLICAVGVILLEMFARNLNLLRALNHQMDPAVISYVSSLPELESRFGPVTGNSQDNYAGYIAHMHKREFWNSIDPTRNEDPATLEAKLKKWKIEQVIWLGEVNSNLDQVSGFQKSVYQFNGKTIFIYSRNL